MDMAVEERDGGMAVVRLRGRLDTTGAGEIELRFSVLSGARRGIVVDMSEVSFLASLGIRVLLIGAKTTAAKGGKMVLLSPQPHIADVLKTARIDSLIPIFADLAAATEAVKP
jgi:anti-sigma B factor antagonist